jgi:hypothetical protein
METNRTSVERTNDLLDAVTQEARRSNERREVRTLKDLELALVGGGAEDTPMW